MDSSKRRARVVVLYNHSDHLVKGEPQDLIADQGVIFCAHAVAEALGAAGVCVELVPILSDVELALAPYPPTEWLIFNLGEGLAGRLFEEVRIAWAIEAMGYRFTGADAPAIALSTHKARAKAALQRAGVATPAWRLFCDPSQVLPEALEGLAFPLFVKPGAEDGSLGINEHAVVHSMEELGARVTTLVESYRQAALAEAFVDGREFNISVWGNPPVVLPLAEIDFVAAQNAEERIVSFKAKWEPDSPEFTGTPVICPARVSPELERRIADVALRAWHALDCRGYARIDMRVDRDEIPYVIEVNCNPDISPDAGFFRAARAAGYSYQGMALHILQMAMEQTYRYDRNSTSCGR
jgi:D-alanine-D-alanine ligase